MRREDWLPSKYQHLCNEHFTPSCFDLRWGIRYLASDAVPTLFQHSDGSGKRKCTDKSERKAKRGARGSARPGAAGTGEVPVGEAVALDTDANTLQLYTITVDPSQPGQPLLLEASALRPQTGTVQSVLPVVDGQGTVTGAEALNCFPVALFHRMDGLGEVEGEQAEVVVISEQEEGVGVPTEVQEVVIGDGASQAVPTMASALVPDTPAQCPALVIENVALETLVEPPPVQPEPTLLPPPPGLQDPGIQIIAYFETIPNATILPPATQTSSLPPPDTVLSSALCPPIVSTLPIISKHTPSPSSLVLTLEKVERGEKEVEEEGDGEGDQPELQGKQLEEHRYHRNSLSKEQLEAIVVELQKKVKVLQQRHRRHLDKLLGLESTVSQLRHSNLLSEERLRLLERAYLQTSAVVSEAGETVAIICEEENTTYLYTVPSTEEEEEEGRQEIKS
ncbi:THAP domain-containing protein 5 isoform X2 [Amia ocellicauda]